MPVSLTGESGLGENTVDQIQLCSGEHLVKHSSLKPYLSLRRRVTPQNKSTANLIQMQIQPRGNNLLTEQKCMYQRYTRHTQTPLQSHT